MPARGLSPRAPITGRCGLCIWPTQPRVQGDWVANAIDAFIFDRLRRAKLDPSPEADPRALIRRVYLLVLGLPPTPEEIERFLAEPQGGGPGAAGCRVDEQAYRRLIDDALSRPQFGERRAQHWLDVIRWAENWGYETNAERPEAWPFRDWVIRSLNDDLPYDRFVFDQIAGDTDRRRRGNRATRRRAGEPARPDRQG